MITIIQISKYPKILSTLMGKLSTGMALDKYLQNWSDWSETNGCQF